MKSIKMNLKIVYFKLYFKWIKFIKKVLNNIIDEKYDILFCSSSILKMNN